MGSDTHRTRAEEDGMHDPRIVALIVTATGVLSVVAVLLVRTFEDVALKIMKWRNRG